MSVPTNSAPEKPLQTITYNDVMTTSEGELNTVLDTLNMQERRDLLSKLASQKQKGDSTTQSRHAYILEYLANGSQKSTKQAIQSPAASTQEGQDAKKKLDTGVQSVAKNTQTATEDTYTDVVQTQTKKAGKDVRTSARDGVSFKEADGTLTLDAMKDELSDLDRSGDVESKNTTWWSRSIFNKGEQKFLIGELQVKEVIKDLSKEQINDLATRLGTPLDWQTPLDVISIKRDAKIAAFQHALIEQATALNIVSKTLLGNAEASAGLASIVYGTEPEFKNELLTNKAAINKIQEMVKNDRGFGEKLVSALLKVGIMLPVTVLSGGLAMGSISSRDIGVDGEKGGLRLKKDIGKSGSVVAAIEALGVKLEANWNDPSTRLVGRTQNVLKALKEGITPQSVNLATDANIADASKDNFSEKEQSEFDRATAEYKKLQSDIMTKLSGQTLDDASQKVLLDSLVHNALMYNGHVEEIKGFELKGLLVGAGLSGLAVGLTGSKVSSSATLDANVGASRAEAKVNQRTLTPEKKQELLNVGNQTYTNQDGIETVTIKDVKMTPDLEALKNSGHLTLSPDGKTATITTKVGEKLLANPQDTLITDGSHKIYYNFAISSGASDKVAPSKTTPELSNWDNEVDDIVRARDLANIMHQIRGEKVVKFQEAYAADPQSQDTKKEFQNLLKSYPQLKSFFQQSRISDESTQIRETFEKTQGGRKSRELARGLNVALSKNNSNRIESSKTALKKYYETTPNLLTRFSELSNIPKDQLQATLNTMISSIDKNTKIQKLNVPSQVMFAQLNGDKSHFRAAVSTPAGLPVIGTPQPIGDTGRSLALAYEPGAECFNVVIINGTNNITTPTDENAGETYGIGTVLADRRISATNIGIAGGISYDKLTGENKTPDKTGDNSSKTGNDKTPVNGSSNAPIDQHTSASSINVGPKAPITPDVNVQSPNINVQSPNIDG